MSELQYQPGVIEEHAQRLNRRAHSMAVTTTIIGALMGGAFGAVPLTSLGEKWPIPHEFGFATLLAGILVGALIGYVIGDARGFGYRLQAQTSLCQLRLERNTAALLSGVYEQMTRQQEAPPAPVEYVAPPAPAPAPVPVPVPVPVVVEPTPEPAPARIAEAPRPVAVEPAPEPVRLAEAPRIDVPAPAPEPEPEPAPVVAEAPAPTAGRFAEAPPNLDTMSLEEIARLSNSGLI